VYYNKNKQKTDDSLLLLWTGQAGDNSRWSWQG